ncbi:Transposase IS4 [Popillia japonica]|uniref:Transposase IS4 n=1 Tax=Popillia japonica TaxID=7064 RepID=A0AAW1NB97_POPJA
MAYDDNLNVGDGDDVGLADNLSRHQLQARAEIIVQNNNDVEGTDVAVEYSGENPGKVDITWMEGDLVPSQKVFPNESIVAFKNLTIVDTFEKFIDKEIVDYLIEELTNCALFQSGTDSRVTHEEMKYFIAILIRTSYNSLPGRKYYCESRTDIRNAMVSDVMKRTDSDKF